MLRKLLKSMGGVAVVGLATLTLSCASIAVSTDHDKSTDFQRYRTFAYLGGHVWVNGVRDDSNTLVKDRIHRSVVATLTSKGLREVTQNPDVYVAYLGGARTRTELEATGPYTAGFGPYFGIGGWWGPMYVNWWARTYNEGTLVFDVIDAQTRKLVWRAYAQTEVNRPVSDEKIRKVTDKAFKNFPPAPGH